MRPRFRLSLYLFAILFTFSASLAQAPDWASANSAGGTGNDRGAAVAVDAAGNSYVAGYFYEEATFGSTTLTSTLYRELFVAKMAPNGTWLWATRATGSHHSSANAIALDAAGNAYITGDYHGTPDFGGHSFTSTSWGVDIFVAKINSSGTWQWAATAGSIREPEKGTDLVLDAAGNIFITGYFEDTATFGSSSITSSGNSDIFIASLNSSGVWQNAFQAGGPGNDYGFRIDLDASSNIFVSGAYQATASFGSYQLTNSGNNGGFIAKVNSAGTFLWVDAPQGAGVADLAVDGTGDVYVTGSTDGEATFGSLTVTGEMFLAKINSAGTWTWAYAPSGDYYGEGDALAVDSDDNIYCTGYFSGDIDFGATTLQCDWDYEVLFVAKLSTTGEWVWAKQTQDGEYLGSESISINEDNAVAITGNFDDTIHLGSQPMVSAGSSDIFCATLQDTVSFAANFSADITDGEAPITVNFTDHSIGNPTTWEWDFQNDGTTDSYSQNPEWTYTEAGVYSVTLTISDGSRTAAFTRTDYINTEGTPGEVVPDANFRAVLNSLLGQSPDYQPTIADLNSITGSVLASESGIQSIEGAQHLINVTDLFLMVNQISDLTPLSGLTNLQILYAYNNAISDVTPLAGLSNLVALVLDGNEIHDITPLAELTNLVVFTLGDNLIDNISMLADFPGLAQLNLNGNQISDISALVENTGLGIDDILYLSYETSINPLSYEAINVHIPILQARAFTTFDYNEVPNEYAPCYPDPTRHATVISNQVELKWRGNTSMTGMMYEVWLGESPDNLSNVGNGNVVNDTLYNFTSTLTANTEYWWRIKATDNTMTVWGGLWHFTTGEAGSPPIADFSANTLSGESPLTVTFSDESQGGPLTWAWDFENDGTVDSEEQNPQHQYLEAGVYSVSLTVSNSGGNDTEVKSAYITVTSPGNTFTVKQDGSGDYTSIQAAIDGVSDDQVVVVYPGTYFETINFEGKAITVASLFASTQEKSYIDQTIINGDEAGNVVRINTGETLSTELIGFTITNGYSSGSGGGIMMYGTSPTISYCKIVDNTAADYGGGVACLTSANPLLHHLEISNNTSDNGGGLNVYRSSPTLENILIANNVGTNTGGGIAISQCPDLSFDRLTISQNTSEYGGAIMVTSSTISFNNTIMWDNEPHEIYFNNYYDPNFGTFSYSDIEGGRAGMYATNATITMGEGNINSSPRFSTGYRLSPISPCIDTGDPNSELDPDSTRADMGAFYYDPDYVSIDPVPKPLESFVLEQNFPNPFNPRTTLSYALLEAAEVSLVVYNLRGEVVRTVYSGFQTAGLHQYVWDGVDESGQSISTGLYLARLQSPAATTTIKMVYLK